MKLFSTIILLIAILFVTSCEKQEEDLTELKTQKEKVSYTMGYDIGKNVAKGLYDMDLKSFMQGVKDGMADKDPLVSETEQKTVMQKHEVERQKRIKNKLDMQGEINKEEGKKFLAENKNKEGIVTFPTGVQMQIVEQGTGKKPGLADIVVLNFKARFIDGEIFDQTTKETGPLEMPLAQLLPGQQQVLLELNEGGKVIAYIPPNMGFGDQAAGELIPPNTTLIYEMQLLKVKPQK